MPKTIHRLFTGLAGLTLFLIFAGALVKSTGSSLSVPDWPLSYGQVMPPMIGGVFFEHSHRMIAATVGLYTVIMAFLVLKFETRSWIKKMAWAAVALVVAQGVLGGLTVLFLLPKPISIGHALLAQSFFCLVIGLAVWTSEFWIKTAKERIEPERNIPIHRLALAAFAACYVQLILGALLRHTGQALPFHIGGAVLAGSFVFWTTQRIWRDRTNLKSLFHLSLFLFGSLLLQIALGVTSYFILNHRFDVIPPPFYAPLLVTAHVATGALVLGLAALLAFTTYRTRPSHTVSLQTTLADYFTLTKPGISITAAITAFAGYILGSAGEVNIIRLLHTCFGTLLSAAGAGCLNMLIEWESDAIMNRTKTRPLPAGRLMSAEVLLLGALLTVFSVLYLSWTVNFITAALAGLTVSIYLYLYTPLKKISTLCVPVGAVAGALPPVMGWTAATGSLSLEALILFGVLFFWQFPHFLSLAWMYKDDYESAGYHMLPLSNEKNGVTALRVLLHSVALLIVSLLPTFFGLAGKTYLILALLLGGGLIFYSASFFHHQTRQQAKRVFLYSLLYIPLLVMFLVMNSTADLWAL
jgi:protoheme IX farnesyltransferase